MPPTPPDNPPRRRPSAAGAPAVGCAFALAAFAIVLVVTRAPGLTVSPDSISYLSAGESLARSGTLTVPPLLDWEPADSTTALVRFPPGFPAAIAAPVALGAPPLLAARIVLAVAAGATVGTLAWLVANIAGLLAGSLLGVALLVTPAVIQRYTFVHSEPLFFACMAALLACMLVWPRRPLPMGLAAAAALLVRYTGLALCAAAVLWALAQDGTWRERLRRAVLAGIPGAAALAAWVLRTRHVSPGHAIRTLGVYGMGPALWDGFDVLSEWLAPGVAAYLGLSLRTRAALFVPEVAALVAIAVVALRRGRGREEGDAGGVRRLLAACGLLAFCYTVLLVVSRVFADPWITFEPRHVAALIILAELALVIALVRWSRRLRPGMRTAVALGLAAWAAASAVVTVRQLLGARKFARTVERSPLVEWARTAGARYALFSNSPATLYVATGRTSVRGLPATLDPPSHEPTPQPLDSSIARAFGDTLVRRGGVIVAFDRVSRWMMSPDSLARFLGLRRIAHFRDGSVWAPAVPSARRADP